jgi:hypothetical protein
MGDLSELMGMWEKGKMRMQRKVKWSYVGARSLFTCLHVKIFLKQGGRLWFRTAQYSTMCSAHCRGGNFSAMVFLKLYVLSL